MCFAPRDRERNMAAESCINAVVLGVRPRKALV